MYLCNWVRMPGAAMGGGRASRILAGLVTEKPFGDSSNVNSTIGIGLFCVELSCRSEQLT